VVASVRPRHWQAPHFVERSEVVSVTLRGQQFDLELRDGVFARGGLDEGSALLCESLEIAADERMLDLGCGGGLVGMLAARLAPEGHATLVDSNTAAVALASDNIVRNRLGNAEALVSDVTAAVAERRFTLVATNPPFHQGRVHTTDTALRFITEAFGLLAPGGAFYLVCNRFLPYERTMRETFGSVREVGGNTRYRVLVAKRQV
jgi:16S rRNA (guanine1207-N2)-methyltransferase